MPKPKTKNKTHTLIISDIHLGSRVSRVAEVTNLLKNFEFKKLILLGDIFEDLNLNRLGDAEWKFLSILSRLSRTRKVRWIEGNHDGGLVKIFAALTGSKVHKVYKWQHRKQKYLAIHGHQFDSFMVENAFVSYLAQKIYNGVQRVDFRDKRTSRYLKRKSKGWLRISAQVARRAVLYARLRQVEYIFCGHTHKAMRERRGNIHYFNSGCWTDIPGTYITIDGKDIEIRSYD
jgi:UDP-2,3-diacylglucosamine pyrophosphatase LpxH